MGSGSNLKLAVIAGLMAAIASPVSAQIVPDKTLPNNSTVTPSGNRFTINGGTRAGGSLFHSFQEFSLPTGGEAFFNNAADIQNILTRVTGKNVSNIDGLIRANGAANLLLINPNGLVFGRNARLNIGGSFLASSASSIKLSDGSFYSAKNPQAPPLLTVNVPAGLQLEANPGEIRVEGNGHGFTAVDLLFAPLNRSNRNIGLQVKAGQTLALIGGDIDLEGGILTAEGGRVEIGAVADGSVSLSPLQSKGFALNYNGVQTFRDINLSQQAAADASGVGSGSIQMAGKQVTLTDGSVALILTQGSESGGEINIVASDLLTIKGTNPDASIPSRLISDTVTTDKSADITVSTRGLSVLDGGQIAARTFSTGDSGKITINGSDFIEVNGNSPINPILFSWIGGDSTREGNLGEINISTRQLSLLDGGEIASPSFGTGNSSNITLNVADLIEIRGITQSGITPSSINPNAASSGNGGNLTINTARLVVADGGLISSAALASGKGGNVVVNASESVEVTGVNPTYGGRSRIEAGAFILPEANRQAFGLPDRPSGDSGNIMINTPRLIVSDGGRVSVANEGAGIAGTLQINAGLILLLDSDGGITAATASGEGGNINITTDFLQLRRNSQISTEAGGTGNGGNINIDAKNIVALENSDITANAFKGNGGNISMTTQGIFGTEFRPQQTPQSDITASSRFGLSGNVTIKTPDANPTSGLLSLSQNLLDPNQKVVSGCNPDQQGSSLTVTGREGIPADPTGMLQTPVVWRKLRTREVPTLTSRGEEVNVSPSEAVETANSKSLVEATGWVVNQGGEVELVAQVPNSSPWYRPPQCQDVSAKSPLP